MNKREPIKLGDSFMDIIANMSEGNPGGLRVLMELHKKDPLLMLYLDDMNIRGPQIWVGYKDHCKEDITLFEELIKKRDEHLVAAINKEMAYDPNYPKAVIRGASFK